MNTRPWLTCISAKWRDEGLRLWLIRHGETRYNKERRCQGVSDIELNDTGREQALAIAARMESVRLDAVHSSPSKRAVETARPCAENAGVEIKMEPGLMELDQGDFEGCKMDEIASMHPEILKDWIRNPADTVMPGGESMRQLQERAWSSIEGIANSYPGDTKVAAICHNLTLSTLMCKILELDLDRFRRFRLSQACISIVDFTALGPVLVTLNDTSHLETWPARNIR